MMTEPQRKTIRIQIVDDHVLMRAGLRMLIESRPGMEVVAEAGTPQEALEGAGREQPDIILLDIDLNGRNGLDLLGELRRVAASARVLVVTGSRDTSDHARAMRLCAMGLVQKDKAAEVLIKAIEKVHAGEVWFERSLIGSVCHEVLRENGGVGGELPAAGDNLALTVRERGIIELVCEGKKNKEIARRLDIKETSVNHYLTRVFEKLGVSNRLELILFAFRYGLVSPPLPLWQRGEAGIPIGEAADAMGGY